MRIVFSRRCRAAARNEWVRKARISGSVDAGRFVPAVCKCSDAVARTRRTPALLLMRNQGY